MSIKDWIDQQPMSATEAIEWLAAEVGVKPPSVRHWVYGVRQVPSVHCRAVERATGAQVRAIDLRPDVFGEPETAA